MHSLGQLPLDKHKIASHAKRTSPVSKSSAFALMGKNNADDKIEMVNNFFIINLPI